MTAGKLGVCEGAEKENRQGKKKSLWHGMYYVIYHKENCNQISPSGKCVTIVVQLRCNTVLSVLMSEKYVFTLTDTSQ